MSMARVFVLGLDGATFDLIRPWAEQGKLPNFARLMHHGVWGPLASVPNMRSAAAWTSFMTGKNPGKHGIYEFYEYTQDYEVKFLHGGHRDCPSLWQILSKAGKRSVVINVPMTYPAEEVNGLLIAGLDAPGSESKKFTHPPHLIKDIEKRFGRYILEPGLTGLIANGNIDKAVTLLNEELDQKIRICLHFMHEYSWDFFMVVFRSLDAVQHCFWKYMDPKHPQHDAFLASKYGHVILEFYKKIDDIMARIQNELSHDDLLLVMSDHGFGSKHPASNQLNQWLAAKGLLSYAKQKTDSILGKMYHLVQRKTSRNIKEHLVKYFPALRDKIHSKLCFAGIDWSSTKAYSDGLFPNIWINVKDREPQGLVEPGNEYKELVEYLKENLLECRDLVSNEKIVDKVFEKSEIYSGKWVQRAPDLLVRWREDIPIHGIMIDSPDQEVMAPPLQGEDYRVISGDHRLHGIFLAYGNNIRAGIHLEEPSIMDLAPTILHSMNLPIPDDMDGKVLKEIFQEKTFEQPIFEKAAILSDTTDKLSYSSDEEESIRERLRGLGYLE